MITKQKLIIDISAVNSISMFLLWTKMRNDTSAE